jgi:hypothetical protein
MAFLAEAAHLKEAGSAAYCRQGCDVFGLGETLPTA